MDWLVSVVPFALILLICPLMMFLMMRGMHSGHDRAQQSANPVEDVPQAIAEAQPLDIAKGRYARGEITKDEFEEIQRGLLTIAGTR